MKRIISLTGKVAFWLSWPILFFYLRRTKRTRVLVIHNGHLLATKQWLGTGRWTLPGGGLHKHEDPLQGAIREVHEETGISLEHSQLSLLYESTYAHLGFRFPYVCYVAVLAGQLPIKKQSGEIVEAVWLPIKKITSKNATPEIHTSLQAWQAQAGLLE